MKNNYRKVIFIIIRTLIVLLLLFQITPNRVFDSASAAQSVDKFTPVTAGGTITLLPYLRGEVVPYDFNGNLAELGNRPGPTQAATPLPLKYTPGTEPKGSAPNLDRWQDPVVQDAPINPPSGITLRSFEGISFANAGNSGWPPDTNGDVDDTYYIQTVNIAIGIYEKSTGAPVTIITFNDFFNGTKTACDYANRGDPVVVYDRLADRWLISDFAWLQDGGPYYECVAVSKTGDPVTGGWWMYAIKISDDSLDDYPKLGVWRDEYVISFNMFNYDDGDYDFNGASVWAFRKSKMIAGQSVPYVAFKISADTGYATLLPSHALSLPPLGAPAYLATASIPNQLNLWELHVDWSNTNTASLTGPTNMEVATFASADSIAQPGSDVGTVPYLDSLSPRPMMQLIYQSVGGVESLWMTHTVAHRGKAAKRWYEVRSPDTNPFVYQQGTYQPTNDNYWMGALAVDQDGNMALGYSLSDTDKYPSIYYTGRLNGEGLGLLPQGNNAIIDGGGSQTDAGRGMTRWGDYSSMSLDPIDNCTFWYTTEYYSTTGVIWQTRIAALKFPSCGQPKGYIKGYVRNAITLQGIPGVTVSARSDDQAMTAVTTATGAYTITLAADTFSLTAGPKAPGYPSTKIISNVVMTAGETTAQDLLLSPVAYLEEARHQIADISPNANYNGSAEPGEAGIKLWNTLSNTGAITATHVTARLESLTTGVTVTQAAARYPNILAGQQASNIYPFLFDISPDLACGSEIEFFKTITDSLHTYTTTFTINASRPLAIQPLVSYNFESGMQGWTSGGTLDTWGLTIDKAHNSTQSLTDSPSVDYEDDTDSWVMSPAYNLNGKRHIQIAFWTIHALEAGYDYAYLEYSTDNGASWVDGGDSLAILNGTQTEWKQYIVDASILDNQPSVRVRFHLVTDGGVTDDGIYIDDFSTSYEPYQCTAPTPPTHFLWLSVIHKQ